MRLGGGASHPARNLRICRAEALALYLANTEYWRRHGNAVFAEHMRSGAHLDTDGFFDAPFVVYHAWRPGWVEASAAELEALARWSRLEEPELDDLLFVGRLGEAGFLKPGALDLDALVERSKDRFIAVQNAFELRTFIEMVRGRRLDTVVEIGTARGGVLYCLAQVAAADAHLISIDLPGGDNCGGQSEEEREVFASFCQHPQRVDFIPSSSFYHSTRQRLGALLDGRRIDLLFIDGDHSYGGVRSDFEVYRPFVAPDGLVVLHDICLFPEEWGDGAEVGVLWRELRGSFRTEEIIDPAGWRERTKPEDAEHAWGIGLVHGAGGRPRQG